MALLRTGVAIVSRNFRKGEKMKLKYVLFVSTLILAKSFQLASADDWIVGGKTVAPTEAIARSTVALVIGPALCTGSVIAPDLIVTAAHCLEGGASSVSIVFATQITPEALKNAVKTTHFMIHPDYRMNQTKIDQNDIGLIEFQGGLPKGYTPNHMLADPRLLTRGENVILAGYGVTDAGTHAGAGTLRETDVKIADENFGKTEVLLAQNDGHGACHGDSGGPAFLMEGGKLVLWGITSRGYPARAPDDCAHESVYTKILDQTDFLRAAIQKLRH